MYEQVKDLKEGKTVQKRIYNHVTGVMDAPEEIVSPNILILEGLHPFADETRKRRAGASIEDECVYETYSVSEPPV